MNRLPPYEGRSSPGARDLRKMRRIIGIKPASVRSLLDRTIGWYEHCQWVADRIVVSNPRKRAHRPAGGKYRCAALAQFANESIDRPTGFVRLPQHQDRRARRNGGT